MKRKLLSILLCLCIAVGLLPAGTALAAEGDTADVDLLYTVRDGEISITGYNSVPENLVIPSAIEGVPVTSIGPSAFYGCTILASVTIPAGVTSIGGAAFYGCGGLASVTIPDSVTSIGGAAFHDCSSLTSVTIPNGVTSIGGSTFWGCSSLTSVTIPAGVTSIGDSAFYECSNLTSVTIPDSVTSIGNFAFQGCSSLTSVTIPDSVTSVGSTAFCGCSGLTSVAISNSVTSIEYSTFWGCSGLTSVTIPAGVTSIGGSAFDGCSGLTSVTIPDSVISIGHDAFYGCSGLTRVTIPDSVTSIGEYAFYACSGLASVTIPAGVTSIGDYVFSGCSSLTSVTVPDSVTSIGVYAFSSSGLTRVTIPDSVTSIGEYAFYACSDLASVTIPDSVTSIGDYTFCRCSSLTSVAIPDSVTSIGASAFSGCSGLASVIIPDSVTSIGGSAFYNCSSLTSVTIPNSVTTIKDNTFGSCRNLSSVTIPDSITSIEGEAFSGCSGLTSVTIPDRVTSIGRSAFAGCSGLTSVKVPNGVTSIVPYTFNSCGALTKISIPSSVTRIESCAFAGCGKLKDINYDGTISNWNVIGIDNSEDGYGRNNNSILRATVHCTDGDIAPSLEDGSGSGSDSPKPPVSGDDGSGSDSPKPPAGGGDGSGGGGSSSPSGELIQLDNGVKYVPYSCRVENKDYTLAQDTSVQYQLHYELDGTLPSGLSLDSKTSLIFGVPMAARTWEFYVKRILSNGRDADSVTVIPCSLTIQSNTDAAVHAQRPNDYDILEYVGTPDQNDPNHFYKTEYSDETLKIDGPYYEFDRLLIDGVPLRRQEDYTVKEGSTVITIHSQTFQRFGEGTHTIAAEFRPAGAAPGEVKRVAQNYTLNLSNPSSGGSSGGGGSSKPSVNTSAQKPQNPQQQTAIPFADVSPADWYYDDVVWAYQEGVMQGVDGSRFDPEGKVSQAVIVTVLARLAKVDLTRFEGETEPGFPEGQYFTAAAIWAKRSGLLPEEGAFTGNEATSRNQMAVMLTKYLTSMGKDTTPPAQPVAFDDASEMTQEGNAAFQVLYQYEIFRGTGGLKMEPAGSTTRAQFAALMHRVYDMAIA